MRSTTPAILVAAALLAVGEVSSAEETMALDVASLFAEGLSTQSSSTDVRLAAQTSESIYTQVAMTPDTAADDKTWVLVAPYGWMPATRGTVGARGVTTKVDASLADVFESLGDLNGAVMGHVEVGKNDWGLIFDGLLMRLSPEKNLPLGGKATVEISSTLLESMAMKRILDTTTDVPGMSRIRADLLAGARYYQVQSNLKINPVMGPTIQGDISKDWVDLVFGGRTSVTVADGLEGFLRADFGGFGIGTSSDLTWNLIAGGEYACPSCPGSSLVLGYRILDIKEKQGSGNDEFIYDVQMQGPFAAVAFRF
ncbi:MAG TPA: hypothetical protein VM510_04065 [Caulifigura sp.]|nr:hypothetical protein [Caulifigura sp.]